VATPAEVSAANIVKELGPPPCAGDLRGRRQALAGRQDHAAQRHPHHREDQAGRRL